MTFKQPLARYNKDKGDIMSEVRNEANFLVEITPALYNRIQQELGDAFTDNTELHYSPYWKMMNEQDGEEL